MIDRILQNFCKFCQVYVNDIVIFFTTLKKHFEHLSQVFIKLNIMNIHFTMMKFFLEYLSVHFLKQKIDIFKLITVKNKLAVITNFEFFKTLTQLKKYLDLIDYLHQYIFLYAVISDLLQL